VTGDNAGRTGQERLQAGSQPSDYTTVRSERAGTQVGPPQLGETEDGIDERLLVFVFFVFVQIVEVVEIVIEFVLVLEIVVDKVIVDILLEIVAEVVTIEPVVEGSE
jgi:hypothetical protein